MTITAKAEERQITLVVEGRIDANTSAQLQAEILKTFQRTKRLVLDFEKVSYLSSAGLRALLIGGKTAASKGATLALVKPVPVVRSILASVGFDKVIQISP